MTWYITYIWRRDRNPWEYENVISEDVPIRWLNEMREKYSTHTFGGKEHHEEFHIVFAIKTGYDSREDLLQQYPHLEGH